MEKHHFTAEKLQYLNSILPCVEDGGFHDNLTSFFGLVSVMALLRSSCRKKLKHTE